MEGRIDLKSVIDGLIGDGLLEPCTSPLNAPVFPVKKTNGSYRLVQDLRAINQIVQTKHPVVLNPYTLLSKIPYDHKGFSVIDLKGAFWACSLDTVRTYLPLNGKTPTQDTSNNTDGPSFPRDLLIPSPLWPVFRTSLRKFKLDPYGCLLQYMDDLHIGDMSGGNQEEVINTTISFINFRISKSKLKFAETEVKYLGHLISKGQGRIGPERIEGITSLPLTGTKQELRKFHGLVGYCLLWIDSSALKTNLYISN
jgi:hypothetical protein